MNVEYLKKLINEYEYIPQGRGVFNLRMLICDDKYYPGIKKMELFNYSVKNTEYTYYINYDDLCKIFNTTRNKNFMKFAVKHFAKDDNFIESRYKKRESHEDTIIRFQSNVSYYNGMMTKSYNLTFSFDDFEKDFFQFMKDMFENIIANQHIITCIKDLYALELGKKKQPWLQSV